MADYKTIFDDLIEKTQIELNDYDNSKELAFASVALEQISPLIQCGDYEVVHCQITSANDKMLGEIHGYAISEENDSLTLFYSLYNSHNSIDKKNNSECKQYINYMKGFFNRAFRADYIDFDTDSSEYRVLKDINNKIKQITTVNLCLLSNYVISKTDFVVDHKFPQDLAVSVWDLDKIYSNFSKMTDHEIVDVDFEEEYNYDISFVKMKSKKYECLLAMFPGKLLSDLYRKYNIKLLYNNVRYFLGFKGSNKSNANIDMRHTLVDNGDMFLAYNNGLTALATEIETDSMDSSDVKVSIGRLLKIRDFRIVNGGQTTAVISKINKDLPSLNIDEVYVPVKIIVSDQLQNICGEITQYSNSQSKIKLSDFTSANPFNNELKALSEKVKVPNSNFDEIYWYYDRLRGQYDHEHDLKSSAEKSSWEKKHPKDLKFNKEELSKVWMSWNQKPFDAVKGACTSYNLYMTGLVKTNYIPDEDYYKKTIGLLIIYKYLLSRKDANKTYTNAKASVIAYTIAYLSYLTNEKFNLVQIWEKQSVPVELKKFFNELADAIYEKFVSKAQSKGMTILSYGKNGNTFRDICNSGIKCDQSVLDNYKI